MTELSITSKIAEIISIDINDVVIDAKNAGLPVVSQQCFTDLTLDHSPFIEKMMDKYATLAASYCAASGATSGIGGVASTSALAAYQNLCIKSSSK